MTTETGERRADVSGISTGWTVEVVRDDDENLERIEIGNGLFRGNLSWSGIGFCGTFRRGEESNEIFDFRNAHPWNEIARIDDVIEVENFGGSALTAAAWNDNFVVSEAPTGIVGCGEAVNLLAGHHGFETELGGADEDLVGHF